MTKAQANTVMDWATSHGFSTAVQATVQPDQSVNYAVSINPLHPPATLAQIRALFDQAEAQGYDVQVGAIAIVDKALA